MMFERLALLFVALLIAPFAAWEQAAASAQAAAPAPGVIGVIWALTMLQASGQAAESTTGSGLRLPSGQMGV